MLHRPSRYLILLFLFAVLFRTQNRISVKGLNRRVQPPATRELEPQRRVAVEKHERQQECPCDVRVEVAAQEGTFQDLTESTKSNPRKLLNSIFGELG